MKAGFLLVVALFGISNVFGGIIHKKNLQNQLDELIKNVENLEEEIEKKTPAKDASNDEPIVDENFLDAFAGMGSDILGEDDNDDDVGNKKRAAYYDSRRWPKNADGIHEIPYEYSSDYLGDHTRRGKVEHAIDELNYKLDGCLQWVPREFVDQNKHYVHIQDSSGCSSYVGVTTFSDGNGGTYQPLNLMRYNNGYTCIFNGIIQHEMLHAIGIWHEQSRWDRNQYVTINWGNIKSGYEGNFNKYDASKGQTFGHPYDYSSVMHYGRTAFGIDGAETITPHDSTVSIGQRIGVSDGDILDIKSYYECSPSPTEPPTEPPTETPTEPPTETPTEPPTETPTEPPTTEFPTEPPTTEGPYSFTIIASQNFTLSEDNKIRARNMRYMDRCNDKYRRCRQIENEVEPMGASVCECSISNLCEKFCNLCDVGVDRYATLNGKADTHGQIFLNYYARDENDQCSEPPKRFTTCMAFNVRRSSEHNQTDASFYGQYSAGKDENGTRLFGYTNEKYEIPKDYMMDEWFSVYGGFHNFACRKVNQFYIDILPGARYSIDIDDIILLDGNCVEHFGDDAGHQAWKHGFVEPQ